MRKRILGVLASAVMMAAALASSARAEPISVEVLGGGGEWHSYTGGSVAIYGTDGFRAISALSVEGTGLGCCFGPGEQMPAGGGWSGLDTFSPIVQFRGGTYDDINGLLSPSSMSFDFVGSATAPRFTPKATNVSTPFTFAGRFVGSAEDGPEQVEARVTGRGTATLFLSPEPEGVWSATGVKWSFADAGPSPAPTPEPASLLLMGVGLVGVRATRQWWRGH